MSYIPGDVRTIVAISYVPVLSVCASQCHNSRLIPLRDHYRYGDKCCLFVFLFFSLCIDLYASHYLFIFTLSHIYESNHLLIYYLFIYLLYLLSPY